MGAWPIWTTGDKTEKQYDVATDILTSSTPDNNGKTNHGLFLGHQMPGIDSDLILTFPSTIPVKKEVAGGYGPIILLANTVDVHIAEVDANVR